MSDTQTKIAQMRELRDAKAIPHLKQYAPVWLVDDVPIPQDETMQFNVVFFHPRYGWVDRRYRYDAFNNVLYHQGQTLVDEDDILFNLEEKTPYVPAETINTVDSYGG
ncbi:MAG: hypothetical protein K8S97_00835 [Anaerolineae bacterium]|nr:hypothetical protein [Anaerolineae bacterium]